MGPDLRRDGEVRGWYAGFFKRLLDILLASIGLLVFTIPMVCIAGWLRGKTAVSPLFRQIRIGRFGEPFLIAKFRTMTEEGEISAVGHWLRNTAMDELPQLIHILRGEMSFVGPRPLIPQELKDLSQIPNGTHRFLVRPGLTGLAQLYSEKCPSLSERLAWDLLYVDRCSLKQDVWILLKSLGITLKGAWELSGPKFPPK